MYTPGDLEGKVPTSLIRLIGKRCCKRDGTSGRELLVHIEDFPRTTLPHTVTDLNYKKISLPLHLKLDKLLIKIKFDFNPGIPYMYINNMQSTIIICNFFYQYCITVSLYYVCIYASIVHTVYILHNGHIV